MAKMATNASGIAHAARRRPPASRGRQSAGANITGSSFIAVATPSQIPVHPSRPFARASHAATMKMSTSPSTCAECAVSNTTAGLQRKISARPAGLPRAFANTISNMPATIVPPVIAIWNQRTLSGQMRQSAANASLRRGRIDRHRPFAIDQRPDRVIAQGAELRRTGRKRIRVDPLRLHPPVPDVAIHVVR